MKYYLNPDFENKNSSEKIKYLKLIKEDIDFKIKELEENANMEEFKTNEDNIKKILLNCMQSNFGNNFAYNKIFKIINKMVLREYYYYEENDMYNINFSANFFIEKIKFKITFVETKKNNCLMTNNYYWTNKKKMVDIKNLDIKMLNEIDNLFKIISEYGLNNYIDKVNH